MMRYVLQGCEASEKKPVPQGEFKKMIANYAPLFREFCASSNDAQEGMIEKLFETCKAHKNILGPREFVLTLSQLSESDVLDGEIVVKWSKSATENVDLLKSFIENGNMKAF